MQSGLRPAQHVVPASLTQRTLALRSLVSRRSGCRDLVRLQAPHCQFRLACSAAGQQPSKSADGPKTGLVGPERYYSGGYHKCFGAATSPTVMLQISRLSRPWDLLWL